MFVLISSSERTICYSFFIAAIDSTDRCRKDKSLGVLSQKFLMMFLLSKVSKLIYINQLLIVERIPLIVYRVKK